MNVKKLYLSVLATSSWIQVNLGQTRKVTGIVIQGCPQDDHWITKFKIQHSKDGTTWTEYSADGDVSKEKLLSEKHSRLLSRCFCFNFYIFMSLVCSFS